MNYDLFSPPYQAHSEPSEDAAESIRQNVYGLRAMVLEQIKLAGTSGATDEELQHALHMNPSTQRPRRVELVRMGLVADSGKTRTTRSGRKATVWIAK